MVALTPKRRSELRAEAHNLRPVVLIGDKGLTEEVVAEIDRSLKAHELIKVRAAGERDVRAGWLEAICARLEAHAVQQIGKVFVLYRENPEPEKPKPAPRPAPRAEPEPKRRRESTSTTKARARAVERKLAPRSAPRGGAGQVKRTSPPRSRTPSLPQESGPRRRRRPTSR